MRKRWIPHVAIVALALAVRLAFLAADPYPAADAGLALWSGEMARQIDDHGRWFQMNLNAIAYVGRLQNQRTALIDPAMIDYRRIDARPRMQHEVLEPPGEAVVLAALWKITSERWLPYQLLMVALGALMAPLVFQTSFMLFERREAAYVATLLYAVFPPLAWLSTIPHLDAWAVDLTIVATWLLLRARGTDWSTRSLLAVGAVVGAGCYFRPELVLLAPLIAAAMWQGRWRETFRIAAIPTAVAVLIVAPWTIRNAVIFHQFIPIRTGTGQALWEGLGELPNDFGAVLNDVVTQQQVHRARPGLVYGTPAYDLYLQAKAIRAVEQHPLFYARLVAHRALDATVALNNNAWTANMSVPVERLAGWIEPFLFLVSLAVVAVTRRRYARSHLVLLAVVVATVVPYLLLHMEPRYALPASFAYLIWAGLAVEMVAGLLAVERRREMIAIRR